ncbi:MAG: glycerol-3-phosphate 1-O-acyltransferase PlsY [Lentisphaerae bacterium]|nr:glycerol-3-phosphate 1-O-acyltransferase PlsY [Lentisphaerota bacterium]
MTAPAIYLIYGLLAYLLGAIPFGFLIARARGVDIRTVGSGNIGATNVFRAVGKGWGALVFACDVLKGFIAASVLPALAGIFWASDGQEFLGLTCACLAVGGHNWPIYLKFKGGKGVAASVGALIGLAPKAAGVGLLTWALFFLATRYVSLASIAAAMVVGASVWFFYASQGMLLPAVLTVLCGLVIWRHKRNIQRLLAGTENRFEFRSRPERRPGEAG